MLTSVKRLGKYAAVVASWLFLLVVWLMVSTWIISPLLWVQIDSQSFFVLIGRSLSVSMLLCFLCCAANAKLLFQSIGRLDASDVFEIVKILWSYVGIVFVVLTLSSALLLGYCVLTKPI